MIQCFTCRFASTLNQARGKSVCNYNPVAQAMLDEHKCSTYKLGAMAQVRSRTSRRIVWSANGLVALE